MASATLRELTTGSRALDLGDRIGTESELEKSKSAVTSDTGSSSQPLRRAFPLLSDFASASPLFGVAAAVVHLRRHPPAYTQTIQYLVERFKIRPDQAMAAALEAAGVPGWSQAHRAEVTSGGAPGDAIARAYHAALVAKFL